MLKFIGNGSAFNVERGNNSAYYIEGNQMLLIDCGSNIFERIIKKNLLDGIEHIHVLVTHTHSDHVGSLADLILFSFYSHEGVETPVFKPKLTVHAHPKLEMWSLLKSMGVVLGEHCYYKQDYELYSDYGLFENITFSMFPTTHVNELYSVGFELYIGNTSIYYSGDTNNINSKDMRLINRGVYDYVYVDTATHDYDGNVHLSLSTLTAIVDSSTRDRVWCMHLDNQFNEQEVLDLGFNVTKNIFE